MEWRHAATARRLLVSETGTVSKDWGGRIPFVLAYPNSYAVGMSSLAVHGLYGWLNDRPDVVCERTFASWERGRASASEPLISFESQRPVRDAAVVAFSVSFELDYLNVLAMLRRAAIPLLAHERQAGDSLVIMGGPAISANPLPLADVADAILIGEVEAGLASLVDCVRGSWDQERMDTLEALARLPGMYVPLVHQGQIVKRQWLPNLDTYPLASRVVAPHAEFGDMHLIELARGCGHGCRFCLAGYWYRPPRERSLDLVLDRARVGLRQRRKIGLVSAAVSDYTWIDALVEELTRMGAELSVSSLRVAPLSPTLVDALARGGSRSITLAPEAGSERLRRVINKCINHDQIMAATELVAQHDFQTLKLYFMVGLPGEEDADIEELVALAGEIKRRFPRQVVVNLTPFVPKAHTPFQWQPMAPTDVLQDRLGAIRQCLAGVGVEVRHESVESARVQAALARGDRRLGQALLSMRSTSPGRFETQLSKADLDIQQYLDAPASDAPLPWGFIDGGAEDAHLRFEQQRSQSEQASPVCMPSNCRRCGVCHERKG